jgi:hypothetical protein
VNRAERRQEQAQNRHNPAWKPSRPLGARLANIQEILDQHEETIAWLAWQGYQEGGRGVVIHNPDEGQSLYIKREDIDKIPWISVDTQAKLLHLVDVYDPRTHVVFMVQWNRTDTYCAQSMGLLVPTRVPPPEAKRDTFHTFDPRVEPRH